MTNLARLAAQLQRVAHDIRAPRQKTACIISVGEWGGKRCLLKVRDRNYRPRIKVYHIILDGVEIAYMKDEITGWIEGLNEFGIGLVNTSLLVVTDEAEQEIAARGVKRLDGKRMMEALKQKTIEDAAEAISTNRKGLKGHTFVSDATRTISLEATKNHEYVQRTLSKKIHTRTNHGFVYDDAGYTDGEDYESSTERRNQAMKVLRGLESPEDLAPELLKKRKEDRNDPNNMIRDTDNMRTTSQLVLNLTDLVLGLYLIPKKMQWMGISTNLPKGYEPKISINVYKFKDYDGDGVPDDLEILEVD